MARDPTENNDERGETVDPILDRRKLLAALGATGLSGVGGCLGDDGTGSTPTDDMPTTTSPPTDSDDARRTSTTTLPAMTETIEFTAENATDMFPDNQYTPVATHEGYSYFVWIPKDYRPMVAKIGEDEDETTVHPLDPESDYKVVDDGHHKFSIGVDREGYVHVAGDMHHGGNPWYRKQKDKYPSLPDRYKPGNLMYWVSDEPEAVSSFTFHGDPDDPRSIPAWQPSYLFFKTDTEGTLYAAARVNLPKREGRHRELGGGVYRYDAGEKRWTALGGLAPFEDPTEEELAGIFDAVPTPKTVVWSPEGGAQEDLGWYQPYQMSMRFDASNRLHLAVGVNAERYGPRVTHVLYAYSDDGGESFRRADDTRIDLPITPEPGSQQGSIVRSPGDPAGLDGIWHWVFYDGSGRPAVATLNGDGSPGYVYYQPSQGTWSGFVLAPVSGPIRLKHYADPDGSITFVGRQDIHRTAEFETDGETYRLWDWLRCVDTSLLRREGVFRGVVDIRGGMEGPEGDIAVQTVDFRSPAQ